MKKIVVFLMALTLMLTNLGTVLADTVSAPPASQISSNLNFAIVERTFAASNESGAKGKPTITYVKAGISKKSSTSVSISATTESNISATKIGGYMNVQRWINNKWSTYKTKTFWEYGASHAASSAVITVPSGYYYRLSVTHIAMNGDGTSSIISTTSSTLIN